jgi:ornithine cyclodeaminase/alanine dehydrogenase-like protein (mu-crystallin family)
MSTGLTPPVLTDDQLRSSVRAADAVAWMREAVLAAESGALQAPARAYTDLGEGRLVFTTGALAGEWFGYRSYDTFDVEPGEQVVVLHAAGSGRVQAVAVGNILGQLRTGALGGLAADLLARPDANTLGVIGSGNHAWTQVWALTVVRQIHRAKVYSRTTSHAEAFANRVRTELAIDCVAVNSAEAAARDQDIVVLATNSRIPVVEPGWLSAGAHVTTVGPKQQHGAEFGLDLVEAADVVVTDSLSQLHAYDPPSMVATSTHADRVTSLGAVASGRRPGRRTSSETTLYLSVGLAGSEVHLLHRVATRLGAMGLQS